MQTRAYNEGFGTSWQHAAETMAPPPSHYDTDERQAHDLRWAVEDSRQLARRPSEPSLHDAGPSRSQTQSASPHLAPRHLAVPPPQQMASQRAPRQRAPPREMPPKLAIPTLAEPELAIWPDPALLLGDLQHLECLPVPLAHHRGENPHLALVPTGRTPVQVADATSYDKFWLAITLRRGSANVLEVFTRLHAHTPQMANAFLCRQAAMGYILTRQITGATRWDCHLLASFLTILAVFMQGWFITERAWDLILDDNITAHCRNHPGAELPYNNWQALTPFAAHPSVLGPSHGLSMIPPPPNSPLPWRIQTTWKASDFIMILRSARITCGAMMQLFAYADFFIRSRVASGPLQGINYDGAGRGLYMAPFITATFDAMSMVADLDGGDTMDVNHSRPPPTPT